MEGIGGDQEGEIEIEIGTGKMGCQHQPDFAVCLPGHNFWFLKAVQSHT